MRRFWCRSTRRQSPFEGSAKITADVAKDFADGKVYFNIHTAKNKGGETRGQTGEGIARLSAAAPTATTPIAAATARRGRRARRRRGANA